MTGERKDYLAGQEIGKVYLDIDPQGLWYWSVRLENNVVITGPPECETEEVARTYAERAKLIWKQGGARLEWPPPGGR